jgi:hypothetical protein
VGIIYLDLDKFYLRKIRRSYLSAFNSVGCICCLVKKERRRERERAQNKTRTIVLFFNLILAYKESAEPLKN